MDSPETLATLAHKPKDNDRQNTTQKAKKVSNMDPNKYRKST